jgi:L-asparagine permease
MCYQNRWNLFAVILVVTVLTAGWFAVRKRVFQVARERVGYTGDFPVLAETPLMDGFP